MERTTKGGVACVTIGMHCAGLQRDQTIRASYQKSAWQCCARICADPAMFIDEHQINLARISKGPWAQVTTGKVNGAGGSYMSTRSIQQLHIVQLAGEFCPWPCDTKGLATRRPPSVTLETIGHAKIGSTLPFWMEDL